jgi:hypothetical protein
VIFIGACWMLVLSILFTGHNPHHNPIKPATFFAGGILHENPVLYFCWHHASPGRS